MLQIQDFTDKQRTTNVVAVVKFPSTPERRHVQNNERPERLNGNINFFVSVYKITRTNYIVVYWCVRVDSRYRLLE